MLQTRNGKRTAQAALKIAVALVNEGLCTKQEALLKVEPKQLDALLHPRFDERALKAAVPVANGLPASPGAACGRVYFTAEEAKAHAPEGPVSVSYTHLDVYKRQDLYGGKPSRRIAGRARHQPVDLCQGRCL